MVNYVMWKHMLNINILIRFRKHLNYRKKFSMIFMIKFEDYIFLEIVSLNFAYVPKM